MMSYAGLSDPVRPMSRDPQAFAARRRRRPEAGHEALEGFTDGDADHWRRRQHERRRRDGRRGQLRDGHEGLSRAAVHYGPQLPPQRPCVQRGSK